MVFHNFWLLKIQKLSAQLCICLLLELLKNEGLQIKIGVCWKKSSEIVQTLTLGFHPSLLVSFSSNAQGGCMWLIYIMTVWSWDRKMLLWYSSSALLAGKDPHGTPICQLGLIMGGMFGFALFSTPASLKRYNFNRHAEKKAEQNLDQSLPSNCHADLFLTLLLHVSVSHTENRNGELIWDMALINISVTSKLPCKLLWEGTVTFTSQGKCTFSMSKH